MGKKLQPKLRFRGFTDAWEQRRLGEIATVVGGGTPDTNNPLYWNGDINWFTPAEIGSNAYASKSERRITEEGLEHSSAKLLPAGRTILFTSRASIGLTAILTVDACTNQGFQSLVVSDRTDVFFLFGLCNQIKTQAIRNAAGSTFIEISGKQLAKMPLQIPSLDEQRRIGKIVRTIDSLIAAEKRKLDLLQKKKTALLRQIFERKLRFKGYDNPWERCRLGDITEFADYGIAASAIPYDGTVRYLRITDIDDETRQVNIYELPSPDMKHRSRKEDYLRQGDLVFARTGASVGKTYLNRSDRDDIVHAGFLIRFRLKDNICPEFIYQQTLGENYRKFIAITSQRSGQPGINSSEYADWTLYLTSIEEQNQIGGLFGQLDELIAALTQKIDLLMIKKKALLQQMFV